MRIEGTNQSLYTYQNTVRPESGHETGEAKVPRGDVAVILELSHVSEPSDRESTKEEISSAEGMAEKLSKRWKALREWAKQLAEKTKEFGGVAVPAHIDRSSYSILSNLGFMPPELLVDTVEITAKNRLKMEAEYEKKYNIISNSDAHYLEDIAEPEFSINIMSKTAEKLIEYLCKR